jgi:hypothetical protein
VHLPVSGGKRCDPVKNRAKTVFETHVGIDEFLLFIHKIKHVYQSVQAACDKDYEGYPGEGAGYKIIKIVHFPSFIRIYRLLE